METRLRTVTKALSWQALGLISMSILGFLYTGSFTAGGSLAMASCSIGFLTYFLHERIWAGIRWGWQAASAVTGAQDAGPETSDVSSLS